MQKAKVFKRVDFPFLLPWQVELRAPLFALPIRFKTHQQALTYATDQMKIYLKAMS